MSETLILHGVVLSAQNVGEYDKRLVILTNERGKITAFARGVRRPKNTMIAAANPFVFAAFHLYEGRDAYTLHGADVIEYFDGIALKMPGVFYGYYFLELASYYGREEMEAKAMVNLIFVTLKALMKEMMPLELIRAVYEIRIITENGEFAVPEPDEIRDDNAYEAIRFSAFSPVTSLYTFELVERSSDVFCAFAHRTVKRTVDKTLKSLAVVEQMR